MNTDDDNQTSQSNPAAINVPEQITTPVPQEVKPEPVQKTGKAEAKPKNKAKKAAKSKTSQKPQDAIIKKMKGKGASDKGKGRKLLSGQKNGKEKPSKNGKEKKAAKEVKAPRQPENKAFPFNEQNPYRLGSNYSLAFSCLQTLGLKKPVSRKDLLMAYAKSGKRDLKLAAYDMAVVLSPAKDGTGHRSSRKDKYYVEKLENHMVQLHMV